MRLVHQIRVLVKSMNTRKTIGMLVVASTVLTIIATVAGRSLSTTPNSATLGTIMKFATMVGVDGGFVGHNPIRGVLGDNLPWEVGSVNGSLTTDGHLVVSVRGLVFSNVPAVPPNLRGINDESEFRALVSCLSDDGRGRVSTINITTGGFPATRSGDSNIDTFVSLPKQCVAPIIFVLSGSEEKWFAVTGAEAN
jgi:hypothetical protein